MRLTWNAPGQHRFQTGVDHGVLYLRDNTGKYTHGYAWPGLTTVTQSPSGAESTKQYADNGVYAVLKSNEEFGCTIEAFTYPDEFEQCDGTASYNGVSIGQQGRRSFGFAWRSLLGDELVGTDLGYKLHLAYGCDAAPSEQANATVNDSPELASFSWDVTSTKTEVGNVDGVEYKPTAKLTIDSTKVDAAQLSALEDILYGTDGVDPRLPSPAEVLGMFSGTVTEVRATAPTQAGNVLTIPTVAGVEYRVDGEVVTGTYTMTEDTVVTANPTAGKKFPEVSDDDWYFQHS